MSHTPNTLTTDIPRYLLTDRKTPRWRDPHGRIIPGISQAAFYHHQPESEGKNAWRRETRREYLQYHVAWAEQELADFERERDPAYLHARAMERKATETRRIMESAGLPYTEEMEAAILATPMPELGEAPKD